MAGGVGSAGRKLFDHLLERDAHVTSVRIPVHYEVWMDTSYSSDCSSSGEETFTLKTCTVLSYQRESKLERFARWESVTWGLYAWSRQAYPEKCKDAVVLGILEVV